MTLPLYSVPDIYAVLRCGHQILWDDPDEDTAGSFFCRSCGGWFGVSGFHEDAGTG